MTSSQRNTARMAIVCGTIAIGGTLDRLQNLYTPPQSAPAWLLMGSGTAEMLVGIAFLFVAVTFHHLIRAQRFFSEKSLLGTVLAVGRLAPARHEPPNRFSREHLYGCVR